jgi:4'-phosphopantetheinyl transferase
MTAQLDIAIRAAPAHGVVPTAHRELGGVDVWSVRVDEREHLAEFLGQLDDQEQARAARFRFERDRSRFVARRTFLRRVLSGYVGVPPARIRYRTSATGRPELQPPCEIHFNTSHADGLALVAVTRERLVGVDVERLRPIADALDLARRFYSRPEYEYLESVPHAGRSEAFLRIWTRKESYVKALGAGMSMPFDAFDVLDGHSDLADRLPRPNPGASLVFTALDGFAGHVGAVATSGTDVAVKIVPSWASPS